MVRVQPDPPLKMRSAKQAGHWVICATIEGMREKILKAEVSLLFLFALLSAFYFYFQDSLPDHFLAISSSNDDIGLISYSLTSLLVAVEYFSGIWLIFPLVFFSMVYGFCFARRQYIFDLLVLLPILCFFLMLSYLCFPAMLGQGLGQILQEHLELPYAWAILLLSALASLAGCFPSSLNKSFPSLKMKGFNLKDFGSNEDQVVGPGPQRIRAAVPTSSASPPGFLSESRPASGPVSVSGPRPRSRPAPSSVSFRASRNKGPGFSSTVGQRELMASLATESAENNYDPGEGYFQEIISKIEDKLAEFNVDAKIINVLKGPVVDTFELDLGEGVRVARVTSLAQDVSLALSGCPLRMIYPMEGKTTVGVEVPRTPRKVIYLHEVLSSHDFQRGPQKIPLAMGKNAFGDSYVVDLTTMPHMLVAGATGAGKSVFINTLLVSMLIKMPPEKLKLLLIDPKQLELALYRDLPHLAMPVITDPSEAAIALLWAVEEMERRYSMLSKLEVRSIDSFNEKVKTASSEVWASIAPLCEGRGEGRELPYLVIIIDEFADLILVKNGKTIETNICRLAAKARACGIHLIIATQRPSVDVITGLIKANFPTRVSFRVTAGQDSRTILNTIGAENLLGRGDMLYKHGIETRRLHAAYVGDEQISLLVKKISIGEPNFVPKAMEYLEMTATGPSTPGGRGIVGEGGQEGTSDPLYREAVKLVMEYRQASASMIQRRLKVGYNRAANLIESMESTGVVGPQQGSKPRKVLLDADPEQ